MSPATYHIFYTMNSIDQIIQITHDIKTICDKKSSDSPSTPTEVKITDYLQQILDIAIGLKESQLINRDEVDFTGINI